MPVCIYCKGGDPQAATFSKVEHVLPDAFGGFKGTLTLDREVCGPCNEHFGNTLDLYLARDTPVGLARFFTGQKEPEEYRGLGRRATIRHHIEKGRLAGAALVMRPGAGMFNVQPLPQIGFGQTADGPFEWFPLDQLPSKEKVRSLVLSGHRYVEFLEVMDTAAARDALRERGVTMDGSLVQTGPGGSMGMHRVESVALVSTVFGRALAKIGLNYLSSQFGASTALMPAFNQIRDYVRSDVAMPVGTWWSVPLPPEEEGRPAHELVISTEVGSGRVVADVSFFGRYRSRVVLCDRGLLVTVPARGHRWDLVSMTVEPLLPVALSQWLRLA